MRIVTTKFETLIQLEAKIQIFNEHFAFQKK